MKRIVFVFVLSLVGLGPGSSTVRSTTLTWNGSTSTDWNNATNWLPQQVPTTNDTVVFNSGSLTAPTNGAFATMNWSGGNLYGALTVASNAVLNISGGAKTLYASLTNAGTVTVTSTGYLQLYYSPPTYYGAIYNQPGALFDIQNDQFYLNTATGNEFFNNAGTLRKSAGTGITSIYPNLNNSTGTVSAQTGTLSFQGGGNLGGQFVTAAGATILFNSGSFPLVSGNPASSGSGSMLFGASANITFSGPITNFNLTGGSLLGTNTVTGTMTWTNGSVFGALTVLSNAVLNVVGGAKTLYGTLTNAGTVVATGTSYLQEYYSPPTYYGAIYNLPGALFDIKNDQFYLNAATGNEFFNNAGTLRKSAGTGITYIYPKLNNTTGTVDAETGTLSFQGGGSLGGQFVTAAGATILFNAGSFPLVSGNPASSGSGAMLFGGSANITFSGPITNFNLTGGNLLGTNTVSGTMTWTNGSVFGALTVLSNAVLNISGGAKTLYGTLTNAGTVVATGTSYLQLYYSPPSYYGAIYNLPGALFDIQNDQFSLYNVTGNEFFNNAGTLRKSAGTGITYIYPTLNNTGTVDAETGTISFQGGGNLGGQFVTAAGATILFNAGNFPLVSGNPTSSGSGAMLFGGSANITFSGPITNFNLTGGNLLGTNTVTGMMIWTNGSVFGALTVLSNAVLNISGGAKTLYGTLTNAGTIAATGTSYLQLYYSPPSYYGAIYNLPGALFDIQNDQFSLYNATGNEFFNNAGTLRKSAGTGITYIYPKLNNTTGTVDAETGTLSFYGGGLINGQFNAAAGAAIAFTSGSYTNSGAAQFTGAGSFKFNGTTLTLLNNVIPNLQLLAGSLILGPAFQGGSITNLTLAGMTLQSTNTVTGTMNWTGGTIAGGLTVSNGATLYLGGSSALNLYGALTNAGTVVATNTSYLRLIYSPPTYYGAIYNLAGGLFDIQNDSFYLYNYYGTEFFNNAGTLRKSAGTGTTQIYVLVNNNTGLIEADSGTLGFQIVPNLTGGEVRCGLSSLTSFGKVNIPGNAVLTGIVGVAWLGGYVPATNNAFTIVTFGSHTGLFTSLDLPAAALWATNYTATTFTVTVASINKLVFTVQPVGLKLTNVILAPIVVQVESPTGVPLATNGVPITLSLASGGGTMFGTLTQNTDASGKVTYSDLSFSQTGFKTLRASSALQTAATSVAFKIVAVEEVQWTTNGFLLSLYGTNSLGTTIISATTNLLSAWTPIYTNPPTTNAIQFLDTASTNYRARFYRIAVQ